MRPSQLASLDLSDDPAPNNNYAVARLTEARRELIAAYERIDHVENAVRGLLCMLRKIGGRSDVSPQLREVLITDTRVIDAQEILL